jgi:hypothetical protein
MKRKILQRTNEKSNKIRMKKFFLLMMTVILLMFSVPRVHAYFYNMCYPGLNSGSCGEACDPPFPFPGCIVSPMPTKTPTATPTATSTPTPGIEPPIPMNEWSASCPEQANIIDVSQGIIEINCLDETIDCSGMSDGAIRVFKATPMLTWYLTYMAPRSATGTIMTETLDCSLQPVDAKWRQDFRTGWGGVLTSCFYAAGGCTSADAIPLMPFVSQTVNWSDTDSYPQLANQLWATVPGK